jgi:CheY-like chemotaxis protein
MGKIQTKINNKKVPIKTIGTIKIHIFAYYSIFQKPTSMSNNQEKPLILIAEDTDSNYMLLEAILHKSYNLIRAMEGKEAIDLFLEKKPLLILMDIKMRGMSGLDATRQIRKISKDIPIIAQSAYAFNEDIENALNAGCSDFITKPISRNLLLEKIHKYLPEG